MEGADSDKSTRVRVLLADDHAITREGTRRVLEARTEFDVVGEAGNGEETVELARLLEPDIVILDISMPRLNGIQVVQALREASPKTRVLILTGYDKEHYAAAVGRLGVAPIATNPLLVSVPLTVSPLPPTPKLASTLIVPLFARLLSTTTDPPSSTSNTPEMLDRLVSALLLSVLPASAMNALAPSTTNLLLLPIEPISPEANATSASSWTSMSPVSVVGAASAVM